MSQPVERYVRCTFQVSGYTLEPGLEFRPGEDCRLLADQLRHVVMGAALACFDPRIPNPVSARPDPTVTLSGFVELAIAGTWPSRAWFLELYDRDGYWLQIFQPFGLPRFR